MWEDFKQMAREFIADMADDAPLITAGVIVGVGFALGLLVRGWFA